MNKYKLDKCFVDDLAHPITKKSISVDEFKKLESGVIDSRVFMPNTYGYEVWEEGQETFELWEKNSDYYKNEVQKYRDEIEYDTPTYKHFPLSGKILDIGGGAGILREFIPSESQFISIDPFEDPISAAPAPKFEAYNCLKEPLNFICGTSEFLPFKEDIFDIVHLRSMLDHVHGPDLTIMEARRVLKSDGSLIIGMTIEGDKDGKLSLGEQLKESLRYVLVLIGFKRFKDHHLWHPTLPGLKKILEDNGFNTIDTYYQPYWKGKVVYLKAVKKT